MHQITHMHFDFTTPEALRSLQAMKRKERRAQEKEDKRVEENQTDIRLTFISSLLVTNNARAGRDFLNSLCFQKSRRSYLLTNN